jgi:uncharacterized protein (TIGR03118 family)
MLVLIGGYSMSILRFFRKHKAADHRAHSYRPVLEGLDERCLLSAGFGVVNLASDVPGLARVTDPNLVNPWGIAYSPTGPFWFAENGTNVSDILAGNGAPFALTVSVHATGHLGQAPTGTVFNSGSGFAISENGVSAPSRFLFVTQDGMIEGWSDVVDPSHTLLAVDNSTSGAMYTGLTIATQDWGPSLLFAADFSQGKIAVFDQNFQPVNRPGAFQDPNLPDKYAPFNVQSINDLLFVAYAQQSDDNSDDVAGPGQGVIDVFKTDGTFVSRFASEGALNAPWGLAVAPSDFGSFGGALLVGNNGDGRINAYSPTTGAYLGALSGDGGTPITIPGLWALSFGNGHVGGDASTLFITAGIDDERHGLFSAIQAPDRRGADTAGPGAFDPRAPGEPADYPLPPSAGPAFRVSNQDRPLASAELMPLGESSLAMAPTLSASQMGGVRGQGSGVSILGSGVRAQESGTLWQQMWIAEGVSRMEAIADWKTYAVSQSAIRDSQSTFVSIPHSQAEIDPASAPAPQSSSPDDFAVDPGKHRAVSHLFTSLFIGSVPLVWVYWHTHHVKLRQAAHRRDRASAVALKAR